MAIITKWVSNDDVKAGNMTNYRELSFECDEESMARLFVHAFNLYSASKAKGIMRLEPRVTTDDDGNTVITVNSVDNRNAERKSKDNDGVVY